MASGVRPSRIELDIRFVDQICQQIYVPDSGAMIASGTPQEVPHHPAGILA